MLVPSIVGGGVDDDAVVVTLLVDPNIVGVKASYLEHFMAENGGRDAFVGKHTWEVNDSIIKPKTQAIHEGSFLSSPLEATHFGEGVAAKASYCDYLRKQGSGALTGDSTLFISHAWSYLFLDVVDSIEEYFAAKNLPKSTVIWFDLFSNCQHATNNFEYTFWESTFQNAIKKMMNVLMIMAPVAWVKTARNSSEYPELAMGATRDFGWDDPLTITRAWCIFEIYVAVKMGASFNYAMSRSYRETFLAGLRDAPEKYHALLGRVSVKKSEGAKESDKMNIRASIEASVGFTEVDNMVLRKIEAWMAQTLQDKIAMERAVWGEEATLDWVLTLATLLAEGGKMEESMVVTERGLAASQRLKGPAAVLTLRFMNCKAGILVRQGKNGEALPIIKKAHEGLKQALGEKDKKTAIAFGDLGVCLMMTGKPEQALVLFCRNLELRREVFGEDHPATLLSLFYIAQALYCLKRYKECEVRCTDCLLRHKSVLGQDHPNVLSILSVLAGVCSLQGKHQEALVYSKECVDQNERVLGALHNNTISAVNVHGFIYLKVGNYNESLRVYQDLLDRCSRGAEVPPLIELSAHLVISSCLIRQEKWTEALTWCRATHKLLLSNDNFSDKNTHISTVIGMLHKAQTRLNMALDPPPQNQCCTVM